MLMVALQGYACEAHALLKMEVFIEMIVDSFVIVRKNREREPVNL